MVENILCSYFVNGEVSS